MAVLIDFPSIVIIFLELRDGREEFALYEVCTPQICMKEFETSMNVSVIDSDIVSFAGGDDDVLVKNKVAFTLFSFCIFDIEVLSISESSYYL